MASSSVVVTITDEAIIYTRVPRASPKRITEKKKRNETAARNIFFRRSIIEPTERARRYRREMVDRPGGFCVVGTFRTSLLDVDRRSITNNIPGV